MGRNRLTKESRPRNLRYATGLAGLRYFRLRPNPVEDRLKPRIPPQRIKGRIDAQPVGLDVPYRRLFQPMQSMIGIA